MKRVLVTGGSRGIGFACCKYFAEKGYRVFSVSRSEEGIAAAKKALPEAEFLKGDVRDEACAERVLAGIDGLDVLVNNAGIDAFSLVQDMKDDAARDLFDVNFFGALRFTRRAVKQLIARQGAIVNLASVWGETGGSCESVYSASKGALIAFTKALAKELAPSLVTVNCVSPGVIDTEMNARLNEEERASLQAEIPLGRYGTAEEVASAVYFLANARYITGQILGVNGGFYI